MAETAKSLENIIKELPPDIKQEVRDFVEFLLVRRGIKSCRGKPKFGWAERLKTCVINIHLLNCNTKYQSGG